MENLDDSWNYIFHLRTDGLYLPNLFIHELPVAHSWTTSCTPKKKKQLPNAVTFGKIIILFVQKFLSPQTQPSCFPVSVVVLTFSFMCCCVCSLLSANLALTILQRRKVGRVRFMKMIHPSMLWKIKQHGELMEASGRMFAAYKAAC